MQLGDIVKGIVRYLESIGKIDMIGEIGRELIRCSQEETRIAIVETAVALDKDQMDKIQNIVGDNVEFKVNKELLGGIKVTKGDRQIDLSVRKRLEDIYAA